MGTQIKKVVFVIFFVIFSNNSFCQINNNPVFSSKEEIELLKKYALCTCLLTNYTKVDSAFVSKDVSRSFIFQVKSIDYILLENVNVYTQKITADYYKQPIIESLSGNYIFLYCMDFYESKKLDKFIKRMSKKIRKRRAENTEN